VEFIVMARAERHHKAEVEPATLADSLILSDERPVEHELADDLTLTIKGRLERTAPHIVDITVRYTPKSSEATGQRRGHPMVAEAFTPVELLTNAVREQFVTTVEVAHPNDSEEGKARLQDRLTNLAETIADGRLVVMDGTVRSLLEATDSVQYHPHAERPHWQIRLVDGQTGTDRTVEVSAQEWALSDPGFLLDRHIPDQLGLLSPFHDYPERWRVVRSLWQQMDGINN
jgi:hypothetical protein